MSTFRRWPEAGRSQRRQRQREKDQKEGRNRFWKPKKVRNWSACQMLLRSQARRILKFPVDLATRGSLGAI